MHRKAIFLILLTAAVAFCAAKAGAVTTCAVYASPTGSDANPGTLASPFRTPQKVISVLSSTQTGCFESGTYPLSSTLTISKFGITLSGHDAKFRWQCSCSEALHVTGANVQLADLTFNNTGDPGVTVWLEGNNDVLHHDVINNGSTADHTGIGVDCVFMDQGNNMLVELSKIENCGSYQDGQNDQGLYIDSGSNDLVQNNLIWNVAGFPIQFWPSAMHATVAHNVIDDSGAGVIFAGQSSPSSYDTVSQNIIADSTQQYLLQDYWSATPGVGNSAQHNCLWNGHDGEIESPVVGYTASANVSANPLFVNPGAHDYRLQSGSPCLSVVGYDTAQLIASTR